MKLRIQDGSIRLRLSRGEVKSLEADGRVAGMLRFTPAPNDVLGYSLESSSSCSEVRAERNDHEIRVVIPEALTRAWAFSDEVTIEHLQDVGSGDALRILVEKDFRCAHRGLGAPEENVADLYPNPNDAVNSPK